MQHQKATGNKSLIKLALLHISPCTIRVFSPFLLILLVAFMWFAVAFCLEMAVDPLQATDKYYTTAEHLMMSLFLTIGSATLFDIAIFQKSQK